MSAADSKITDFKKRFYQQTKILHLNNAGQAPMCTPAYEMIQNCARLFYEEGANSYLPMVNITNEARTNLASFLGSKPEEVAYFPSAASAISQVAFGLDLKSGDEIIVWDQEYPSNLYPWRDAAKRAGAKLVVAESGADLSTPVTTIEKLMTPRTKVIATSWVQYRTGAITDLKALSTLAHSKGIFVSADIIQGAGALPFDFHDLGVDAACGGSHKWMLSAHGAGYLLLREEHRERLRPLATGAMTYGTSEDKLNLDAQPRTDMLRYEPGGKAFIEIAALGAAAKFLKETGIDRIAQEIEWLSRKLLHGLRERGYSINSPHGSHHRGSIVNFAPGKDSRFKTQLEIEAVLTENHVTFGKRPPGLRLSPHAFNTIEDIEKVLNLL